MSSLKPKPLTNPLRPAARYRKGKAPAAAVQDDSSEEEVDEEEQQERRDGGKMEVSLSRVMVDKEGVVRVGGEREVGRTRKEVEEEEEEEESSEDG